MRNALRQAFLLAIGAILVFGCAELASAGQRLSDRKPHEGVSRAHRMPVQGIDVSNWQGNIEWESVRAAGTDFVFIKATEGGDYLDPKFHRNWQGAKRVGIPRGAYHMVYWCRPAHEQALWFVLNVPNEPDALPPVLDLEWNGHSRNCPKKIPARLAREKIGILLEAMERHTGKRPIIYTDITFHREVMEGHFRGYNYWLRSVAAEPHRRYRNRPWLFWQFSTTGHVPGIKGPVDRNTFNGSMEYWWQAIPRQRRHETLMGAN